MMKSQVQAVVPLQAAPVAVVQVSVVPSPQHGSVGEQAWPAPGHVDPGWQVPVEEPEAMMHLEVPQHSPSAVQAFPSGWHDGGSTQVPLSQTFEQHPDEVEQLWPFTLQVPASDPGGTFWHAWSISFTGEQVPVQHALPPEPPGVHASPRPMQSGTWQRRTPSVPGRQRPPLQH